MNEEWTPEDEATFRPLKRKYDRIHRKSNRDKQRKRPFKSRLKTQINESHPTPEATQ